MKRFNFTPDEEILIRNFDKNDSKYWESECDLMKSIRKKIKDYYLNFQNETCCYCKMLKQEKHGLTWDVEHIFPRELYPHFTFIPENLAISCKECNGPKSDQEVRKNYSKPARRYPTTGSNINIIHPHFDDYDAHIKVIRDPDGRIFHTPLNNSQKARMTFMICNLFRFQEKSFGQQNLFKKSIEQKISRTLQACIRPNMTQEQIDMAIKATVESVMN